jgi:hypothetical protein
MYSAGDRGTVFIFGRVSTHDLRRSSDVQRLKATSGHGRRDQDRTISCILNGRIQACPHVKDRYSLPYAVLNDDTECVHAQQYQASSHDGTTTVAWIRLVLRSECCVCKDLHGSLTCHACTRSQQRMVQEMMPVHHSLAVSRHTILDESSTYKCRKRKRDSCSRPKR